MIYNDRAHKKVSLLLFVLIFSYLFLRLIYNDTLHDEIATYYFYFYHGDFIGKATHWDANNHLLNSFLGNILYRVFGDNFAILRLPNLIGFIFFFYGSYQLTQALKTPFLKLTGLLALTCIPFVLDYFAYARGYGLSIGFLMMVLHHLIKYYRLGNKKNVIYFYVFMLLSVSANLTLINSALILLGINIIAPYLQEREISRRDLLMHLFFLLCLLPFILFAMLLKKAGALYYGSLDGFWVVTGKSISKMVFFAEYSFFKFLYLIVFFVMMVYFFKMLYHYPKKEWLKQPFILWIILLFGNIITVLLMALLLHVNYPEDRTGMYFIIYFLLAFIYLLEVIPWGIWLQWGLLFFPVSFLFHMNIETSIYSPEQRMNRDFYLKVKEIIRPEHSIMLYNTMYWNWVYNESHQKNKASVGQTGNPNTIYSDIILTRREILNNPNIPLLYDTVAVHKASGYIAFKRKEPVKKTLVDSLTPKSYFGTGEYIDIGTFNLTNPKRTNVEIEVQGHLETFKSKNKIQLIVDVRNKENKSTKYFNYPFFACYQGEKINDSFLHHFIIENCTKEDRVIKIYFWNKMNNKMKITGLKVRMLELK